MMDFVSIAEQALTLPVQQRAKLVQQLLNGLDELPAQDLGGLWLDEAERRARVIARGEFELVTAKELERRVQAILK
jgi:hypothetical protein